MKGKAQFIGFQEGADNEWIPLFNVIWPGNEIHGSTVSVETLDLLGIKYMIDEHGNKLLKIPVKSAR